MRPNTSVRALCLTLGFCTPFVTAAAIAKPVSSAVYDGEWSVLVLTDQGTCDRAYRYPMHITNGRLVGTDSAFDVSGQVQPSGKVAVRVSAGAKSASGEGSLAQASGSGKWTAQNGQCSGTWRAERRG